MTISGTRPPGPRGLTLVRASGAAKVRNMLMDEYSRLRFTSEHFTEVLRPRLEGISWIRNIEPVIPTSPHIAKTKINVESGSQMQFLPDGMVQIVSAFITFDGPNGEVIIRGQIRPFGETLAARLRPLFGSFIAEIGPVFPKGAGYLSHRCPIDSDQRWGALEGFAREPGALTARY